MYAIARYAFPIEAILAVITIYPMSDLVWRLANTDSIPPDGPIIDIFHIEVRDSGYISNYALTSTPSR